MHLSVWKSHCQGACLHVLQGREQKEVDIYYVKPCTVLFKLNFKQLGSILNALDSLTPLKIYFWYKQELFGLPRWLSVKESSRDEGDLGLIPGSGRSPGEGNGNSLQYSCLGNFMDRGAW